MRLGPTQPGMCALPGQDSVTLVAPALRALRLNRPTSPPPPPLQKENEVILYGGEWYDSDKDKTHVYSDVYVLNVEKQTWKRVVSPNG